MKRTVALFLAAGLVIISLIITLPLIASKSMWTYLAPENYQIIAIAEGFSVVYNSLQDKDKQKISEAMSGAFIENGVEIFNKDKTSIIDKNWEGTRPDIIPPLTFKKITPENALADIQKAVFEISYEDLEGIKKAKIANLALDGKTVLAPADPEYLGLIPSPDFTKYILATEKGIWLMQAGKQGASKISKDEFNGKTYNQLRNELQKKLAGIEGPAIVWWNNNPIFSPDSSKIVYTTNRDCIESGGSSLWLYDLATSEERPLIKNTRGEHYNCKGWLNAIYIVYQKYTRDGSQFFITDVDGNSKELKIEGKNPDILSVYSGMIAYAPDFSSPRNIRVIKVELEKSSGNVNINNIYEKSIAGTLRQTTPSVVFTTRRNFSPDGTKLAYLYAPDSDDTVRHIVIADLNTKKETLLKEAPSQDGVRTVFHSFDWLDNQRLLVRVARVVDGMNEISSWIYSKGDSR